MWWCGGLGEIELLGGRDYRPLNLHTAGLAVNRAKRELTARLPPVRTLATRRHAERLSNHRPYLPRLLPADQRLLDSLSSMGAAVTTLDDLGFRDNDALRGALTGLSGTLLLQARQGSVAIRPTREQLLADIGIWRWGLGERLLDIVENYLGLPDRYGGPDVRCEVAGAHECGVRQWHRDVEDHQQLKILIWIREVGPTGGPYEYIPATPTLDATRKLGYVSGYVPSERIDRIVPETERHTCHGPAWTVVLTDPARVFHRVKPPVADNRYSVTFSYTSRRPFKYRGIRLQTNGQDVRLTSGLSSRQRACLPSRGTGAGRS